MRDNTFTPGPWETGPDGIVRHRVYNYGSYNPPIKLASGWQESAWCDDDATEESKANSLLVAAAPDIYDALWETIELSDRNLTEAGRTPECQRVYDIVRAALKRAEGE